MYAGSKHISDVSGRRVTVLGAGRSGIAVATLLHRRGADVFLSDKGSIPATSADQLREFGFAFEEGGHSDRALEADFVTISPGVPSAAPIVAEALRRRVPLYAELEVASWFCPASIVAVTGSNGKTTTTSLIGHVFRRAGRRTFVAGNIGTAFSAIVEGTRSDDVVVLEISSFQLDHIDTFRPAVSVLLNITPDHLDRYEGSMERYAASKYRIFENQQETDTAIYNLDDPIVVRGIETIERETGPRRIPFSIEQTVEEGGWVVDGEIIIKVHEKEERLMKVNQLALKGRHNLYDSLAAAVATRIMDIRSEVVRESLASFEGVPHRLEFVREVAGVRYINDSKATNVNSLWYALESCTNPVVLIAGGRDKGNDYSSVLDLVRQKVRAVIAIGESAGKVIEQMGPEVPEAVVADSMEQAVDFAGSMAGPGDIVLLSPACASFDMFDDFVHRGDTFKRLVNNL